MMANQQAQNNAMIANSGWVVEVVEAQPLSSSIKRRPSDLSAA